MTFLRPPKTRSKTCTHVCTHACTPVLAPTYLLILVALTFARLTVRLCSVETTATRFPERVAGDSTTATFGFLLPLPSLSPVPPFVDLNFSSASLSSFADGFLLFFAAAVRLLADAATAGEPSVIRARVTKSVILLCPVDGLVALPLAAADFFGSGDDVGLALSVSRDCDDF